MNAFIFSLAALTTQRLQHTYSLINTQDTSGRRHPAHTKRAVDSGAAEPQTHRDMHSHCNRHSHRLSCQSCACWRKQCRKIKFCIRSDRTHSRGAYFVTRDLPMRWWHYIPTRKSSKMRLMQLQRCWILLSLRSVRCAALASDLRRSSPCCCIFRCICGPSMSFAATWPVSSYT